VGTSIWAASSTRKSLRSLPGLLWRRRGPLGGLVRWGSARRAAAGACRDGAGRLVSLTSSTRVSGAVDRIGWPDGVGSVDVGDGVAVDGARVAMRGWLSGVVGWGSRWFMLASCGSVGVGSRPLVRDWHHASRRGTGNPVLLCAVGSRHPSARRSARAVTGGSAGVDDRIPVASEATALTTTRPEPAGPAVRESPAVGQGVGCRVGGAVPVAGSGSGSAPGGLPSGSGDGSERASAGAGSMRLACGAGRAETRRTSCSPAMRLRPAP